MKKDMHTYLDWRKRLVIFNNVYIATEVERSVAGRNQVINTVFGGAHRKSIREIHNEIRQAQNKRIE